MTRNPLTSEEWALLRASVQQSTADETKKKWGQGRSSKPAEDAINRWVAQQLINDAEWARMEQTCPGDLRRMAESLDLPVAAVIWRARSIEHGGEGRRVELTPEALTLLGKTATGSGGIQSLLRGLQANLDGQWLTVQRKQFERLREYLVNLGGGGRARLQAVMDCVLAAVARSGGLLAFFGDTAVKPVAAKKPAKASAKSSKPAISTKSKAVTKPSAKAVTKSAPAKAKVVSKPAAAKPAESGPTVIQWKLPSSRGKS
ncbi:hypothetical protein IV102_19150 [bacterium]|nr:hypothetical protein [bacterium]